MTAAHATIFYELWSPLGRVGTVLVPIGAGPMLDGIVQGALTLEREGLIDAVPVPVASRKKGARRSRTPSPRGGTLVEAWTAPVTGIPGSINDPLRGYPDDGTRTLRVIRAADGQAVAVGDDEIRQAMLDLGRLEGIAAEPASATPLAALRRLPELPRPVVLVVSGTR